MKKVLATILAIVYLATATNATITIHYCMGKVYSVDLMKKDNCSKCGMKKSDGCCRDEVKIVKIQDKQQLISKTSSLPDLITVNNFHPIIFDCSVPQPASKTFIHNNSPPGSFNVSLNILNSIFRI